MASSAASVLIVAKAASLREGLAALLKTIPSVGAVYVAEEPGYAVSLAHAQGPQLILVDAQLLGSGLSEFLAETAPEGRTPACILLVEDQQQESAGRLSGGVEVLWKGLPADQLLERVRAQLDFLPRGSPGSERPTT